MNFKTLVWKDLHARIWFFVSTIMLILIFTVSMIATQWTFLRETLYIVAGSPPAILDPDHEQRFFGEHETQDEAYAAGTELNIRIAEEGFVMLQNDFRQGSTTQRSLPLSINDNISVFGRSSVDLVLGGSGSGARQDQGGAGFSDIFDSLDAADLNYNAALTAFYRDTRATHGGPGRPNSPYFGDIIQGFPTGETPIANLTDNAAVTATYSNYNDAALVVFSRIGGEGFDLPRRMTGWGYELNADARGRPVRTGPPARVTSGWGGTWNAATRPGTRNHGNGVGEDQHGLQIDENEAELLLHIAAHFDNIILVINSNNILEMSFLDDPEYWFDVLLIDRGRATEVNRAIDMIRSVIWIGSPGSQGIMALGRILNGTVNPSGRTVSTHARDFRLDPTWNNFSDNRVFAGNAYLTQVGNALPTDNAATLFRRRFVEYEEGIFLDYRYWETRAFEMQGRTGGDNWFNRHVAFPFGWGLSYSTFDWDIESVYVARRDAETGYLVREAASLSDGGTLTSADYDAYIVVDVEVTNTSQIAGKDVVQLYVRTPYTRYGIEKAHVVLMDFAKTGLLAAGASETLTLTFNMFMLASYDDIDRNQNGFRGWETEAGNYTIYISRHSNSWARNGEWDEAISHDFVVPAGTVAAMYAVNAGTDYGSYGNTGFTFRRDPHTPNSGDIINRFDDAREGGPNSNIQFLTRADFRYADLETNTSRSWPTTPTLAERIMTTAWRDAIPGRVFDTDAFPALDRPGGQPAPWYSSTMPTQGVILARQDEYGNNKGPIQLVEMIGVPRTDNKWDTFLNQLTVSQMVNFIDRASFGSGAIMDFGIPRVTHADGPAGFVNFMGDDRIVGGRNVSVFYVSHPVIAATFSRDLAREFGRSIGEESLIGDVRHGGLPYTGWYAPGANIHRSPFSGRNWEYFSADPILAGRMAAQVILGANEFGMITFAKHFALNDQETDRMMFGLITWATEQSMREIYFRVFELLVKEGRSLGIMSAFNRIGTVWTGADYRLLNEVLREEWGFAGVIITDFANNSYQDPNRMIRAGGDINLYQGGRLIDDDTSATHVTALRRAMHNNLYVLANSNLFNVLVIGYRWPWWIHLMLWGQIGLLIGFLVWGFFALNVKGIIKGTHKLSKAKAGADGVNVDGEADGYTEQAATVDAAESSLEDGAADTAVEDYPETVVVEEPAAEENVEPVVTEDAPAPKKTAAKKKSK